MAECHLGVGWGGWLALKIYARFLSADYASQLVNSQQAHGKLWP